MPLLLGDGEADHLLTRASSYENWPLCPELSTGPRKQRTVHGASSEAPGVAPGVSFASGLFTGSCESSGLRSLPHTFFLKLSPRSPGQAYEDAWGSAGSRPPSRPARAQVGNCGWAAALGLCRNEASVAQRLAGAGLAVRQDQQHSRRSQTLTIESLRTPTGNSSRDAQQQMPALPRT